jgi:hypothetical protein
MPTLVLRRLSWIVPLLAGAMAAQAQDLHIKKSITVGGNFVSSTDTSIKGARERTVSQSPTGSIITLRQCDLKRTVTINEQAQTYYIAKDSPDEAAIKAAAMMSGGQEATSGGYITETIAITDTGERKTMYGYPARHLKSKVEIKSSQNACTQISQSYEMDGWYADISKEMLTACQQFLPPIRQSEGCSDRIIRKQSGSGKLGYPLAESLTLRNPNGGTTQIGSQTSEISKQPLEKELFEIPAGYTQVKSLAELNGGPRPQVGQQPAQPAMQQQAMQQQAMQQMQQPAQNNKQNGPSMSQMMNPANQLAFQQQAMAQAQALGLGPAAGQGGMPNGMTGMGMQQPVSSAMSAPQALGPKTPGKIRIGIAPPDAQVGQGTNTGGDYSTPIRNAEIALMSGPAIEIAPLDSHIPMQLQAEAAQKQCDYIMFSAVTLKHNQGGGFGRFAHMGSIAASMTPIGAMAHGMGGAVAAETASVALSQMAQQQAMSQLAGFNGQVKPKDDVTVQYQLVATGQTAPLVQNSLQGKAKSNGEDVLTPLLTQAATEVLTKVSQK